MKLWYQSGVDFDHYQGYHKALTQRFSEISSPDTKVTLKGTNPRFSHGLSTYDCVASPYAFQRTYVPMYLSAAEEAERTGYDAFIVASFSEPVLRELRSLATIPIISASECSLLTACTVAPKIGLVTLSRLTQGYIEKSIANHHLEARVSGVHVVGDATTEDELDKNFDRAGPYLERFKSAAREVIAKGAEAIIPAEGLVAAMIAVNHLYEIDQIPIIDSIAAAILFAEFAVAMKHRAGLEPSRRFAYPRPSAAAIAALIGKT
jgi:Asp/Glu/hydantoin racemase